MPGPIRVLLVEDDSFQARTIHDLIVAAGKPGTSVTLAGSLEPALRLIRTLPLDIVLLDLMLPDAKGVDGLNRIVQTAPRLPVLILTGLGREELIAQAFEHGAQDYLVKGDGDEEGLLRAMAFAIRRKGAELRRLELARRDPLTGLGTRALLLERMQRAKRRADRNGRSFAVLFLDLDGFKKVNDGLGHMAGDQVLRSIGQGLAAITRRIDTVARLGGDEFVILAEGVAAGAAAAVADKALAQIGRPIVINGRACKVTGSIGISLYPHDAEESERLLALADAAMYAAKQIRPNHFLFAAQREDPSSLLLAG